MEYFETYTQYDERFGKINHNVCSLFALVTCHNFLKNYSMTQKDHEQNINTAVKNFTDFGLEGEMDFKSLLAFGDLNINNIDCTTVELVKSKELGFDIILPNDDKPFCIIFLKNSKYFVVMYNGEKYGIRDCHEICQYNYLTKDTLIEHLNTTYQFDHTIDLDGFSIDTFSNIEYMKIFQEFNVNLVIDYPVINTLTQVSPRGNTSTEVNFFKSNNTIKISDIIDDYTGDYTYDKKTDSYNLKNGKEFNHNSYDSNFNKQYSQILNNDFEGVNYDEYQDEDDPYPVSPNSDSNNGIGSGYRVDDDDMN
jgi:hypothetical protein